VQNNTSAVILKFLDLTASQFDSKVLNSVLLALSLSDAGEKTVMALLCLRPHSAEALRDAFV